MIGSQPDLNPMPPNPAYVGVLPSQVLKQRVEGVEILTNFNELFCLKNVAIDDPNACRCRGDHAAFAVRQGANWNGGDITLS